MKRFTFILFALMLFIDINLVQAQSLFSGGVRAGAALTNLHGNTISGNSPLNTFNGGFFLSYELNSNLAIQPEANLMYKGATHDLMLNEFPYKKINLIYFQVPVLLKFSSSKEWSSLGFKPSIFAGPALDISLDKELEGEHLIRVNGGYSIDQKAEPTAFEFVAGIGGTINDLYVIDLRYGYGLTEAFQQGDTKTSSIALSVGFKF